MKKAEKVIEILIELRHALLYRRYKLNPGTTHIVSRASQGVASILNINKQLHSKETTDIPNEGLLEVRAN